MLRAILVLLLYLLRLVLGGAQIGITPLECTERRFAPQSHNRLLAGKDEANAHGQEKSRLG